MNRNAIESNSGVVGVFDYLLHAFGGNLETLYAYIAGSSELHGGLKDPREQQPISHTPTPDEFRKKFPNGSNQ